MTVESPGAKAQNIYDQHDFNIARDALLNHIPEDDPRIERYLVCKWADMMRFAASLLTSPGNAEGEAVAWAIMRNGLPTNVFLTEEYARDVFNERLHDKSAECRFVPLAPTHAPTATPTEAQAVAIHPRTRELVERFSRALLEKLAAAEKKYGYSDGWAQSDWMDECRQRLLDHLFKGDPRDVAAYCAFLWHHGEPTNSRSAEARRESEWATREADAASLAGDAAERLERMADLIMRWPVPKSVCSDACMSMQDYAHPRFGTSMLTHGEALQLLEYLFANTPLYTSPTHADARDAAMPEQLAKEIYQEVDGYFVFDMHGKQGFLNSNHLHAIANELDRRNKDWDAAIAANAERG
jgi:hypothetical protein